MEKEYMEDGQPLFYIEQPEWKRPPQTGQTVSVKKKTSDTENKRKKKRERDRRKIREKTVELEKDSQTETVGKEEPEATHETKREQHDIKQDVLDTLDYLEDVPHYIHPVITCETEEEFVEGSILETTNETITIQEDHQVEPVSIKLKEILNIRIISL
ncbi:hypothetical protein [Alteribacillus iranensis]|uniref:hypothetical protein n=1 Tax=Alteribacillus iranensis TaxID=930128 RepID=UPI001160B40D|nr:hypothetical protein [Alteribacillus iranensis]